MEISPRKVMGREERKRRVTLSSRHSATTQSKKSMLINISGMNGFVKAGTKAVPMIARYIKNKVSAMVTPSTLKTGVSHMKALAPVFKTGVPPMTTATSSSETTCILAASIPMTNTGNRHGGHMRAIQIEPSPALEAPQHVSVYI